MAVLAVSAACGRCWIPEAVAHKTLSVVEGGKFRLPAFSTTRQHGNACLASSSSCQMYGSAEFALRVPTTLRKQKERVQTAGVRCQGAGDGGASNSLDIWLGRGAMLAFVTAIGVEIGTGKGVLESAGLTTPLPTVALGLAAFVGAITAFGIFRSGSKV